MSKILCLANSPKEGARCIAGLELSTGKLVRPVSESKSQAIPNEWAVINGKSIKPLDVIDISFASVNSIAPYQAENRLCHEDWKYIETRKVEELIPFCESDTSILHTSTSDAIPERYFKLKRIPQQKWKSLQLIRSKNISLHKDDFGHWKAMFRSKCHREYDLRVTDEYYFEKSQNHKNTLIEDCLLLFSLSKPWRHRCAPKSKPLKCYKLIAGIMPLV